MKPMLELINEVMTAYSDCNGHAGERNLKYLASAPLNPIELIKLMAAAIPEGYNAFEASESIPRVVEVFGDDAEYFIARENSVCLYIKPKFNLWFCGRNSKTAKLEQLAHHADEIMFCPEHKMFRVWWD